MRTQLQIDPYFDLTCQECCKSWSTDFDGNKMASNRFASGGMGMATDKKWLRKAAHKAGWRCRNGRTLCPECLEKAQNRIHLRKE